jgi:hypothetical protein
MTLSGRGGDAVALVGVIADDDSDLLRQLGALDGVGGAFGADVVPTCRCARSGCIAAGGEERSCGVHARWLRRTRICVGRETNLNLVHHIARERARQQMSAHRREQRLSAIHRAQQFVCASGNWFSGSERAFIAQSTCAAMNDRRLLGAVVDQPLWQFVDRRCPFTSTDSEDEVLLTQIAWTSALLQQHFDRRWHAEAVRRLARTKRFVDVTSNNDVIAGLQEIVTVASVTVGLYVFHRFGLVKVSLPLSLSDVHFCAK